MNRYEFYKKLDEARGTTSETFLCHYGIIGQKWGQRRWQNVDGTFNEAGKERYFGKSSKNSSGDEDQVGSIFNKKNVDPYNDKYRTYKIKDMHADEKEFMEINGEAKNKDISTYIDLSNKLKQDTNIPDDFIEKYYLNIKSDIADELQRKYSNISSDNILRQYGDSDEEYYYPTFEHSREYTEKINDLTEKRDKYAKNSAKWSKIDSEIERADYEELIKNSKQEKEFYNDVEQYIKDNYEQIKEDIKDQYKRNPEWEVRDDATYSDDGPIYNDGNIKINNILRTEAESYGYKPNKDKYNDITLDKEFKSKDDGKLNLKLDTREFQDNGIPVKQMKQRMKNNEKFIKNFDKTNDYIRSEVADWLYDQYCDDMEYYDKKPLSYEKFLNKINLQPDIDSTYYSKDENKYHAIYHLNIPGYDEYCGVDFVGDGKYVDIDSLD